MNSPIFFENAGDDRGTPKKFFELLDEEFHFDLDAAADEHNHKCALYYGKGGIEYDALEADWGGLTVFLNPPYSVAGAFVQKAREEADKGATVVLLLPVRSDTKYWHRYIWDKNALSPDQIEASKQNAWYPAATKNHQLQPNGYWRPGVVCRFIPGRLTFELQVPADLRIWIKAEHTNAMRDVDKGGLEEEKAEKGFYGQVSEATGLPKMSIERILQDFPDEDLLEGAPFPSCVVIFTKAEDVDQSHRAA